VASTCVGMIVDVFLPLVLFLIGVIVVFFYSRLDKNVDSLLGGKELRLWHIILLVAATGITVTIFVFIPKQSLLLLFSFSYTAILFLFTYLFVPKWYLAIAPPIIFVLLFLYFWNIYLFNFFAILIGVSTSIYMGKLFTWKTTAAFVSLLTIIDIIQVLVTRFTVASAEKTVELGLPVGIILPTFPFAGGSTFLGLGDIFLMGLIGIQNTRKYGRKFGLTSTVSMIIVFFLLQTALLNSDVQNFPATVFVVSGWLTFLAAKHLYSLSEKEAQPQPN
jgi:presenilin-like A22 family membrane protease